MAARRPWWCPRKWARERWSCGSDKSQGDGGVHQERLMRSSEVHLYRYCSLSERAGYSGTDSIMPASNHSNKSFEYSSARKFTFCFLGQAIADSATINRERPTMTNNRIEILSGGRFVSHHASGVDVYHDSRHRIIRSRVEGGCLAELVLALDDKSGHCRAQILLTCDRDGNRTITEYAR